MRLNNLLKSKGIARKRKRLGHGRSSGHGKTSGRGQKGQKARSGNSLRPGFESGHVPLYRRLPGRGFNNAKFRSEYAVVNVGDLSPLEGVEVIDRAVLVKAGLIRKSAGPIKILGRGEIEKAFKVHADKFSASATAKIKAAGGEIIEIPSPKLLTKH